MTSSRSPSGLSKYSTPSAPDTRSINAPEITFGQPGFGNYLALDPHAELAPEIEAPETAAPSSTNDSAPSSSWGWLDGLQTALDAAGFLPVVGTAADLINGGIHATRGNYVEAGFSVIAMVPVVGDSVAGARKVAKAADKVGDAAQGTDNLAKTTGKVSEGVTAAKCTPGSSTCFTAGTQIVVGVIYNEEDCSVIYVTESIENIEVGDLVYSYDTLTCEVSQKEVTATFVRESDHLNYLTIVDENGSEQIIETTDSHPFWVVTDNPDLSRAAQEIVTENGTTLYHENLGITEFGYFEAKDLRVGDVFLGANGELSTLVAQERVTFADGIKVYNFTVDGNHNYFVIAQTAEYGQTSILVHNAGLDYNVTPVYRGGTSFVAREKIDIVIKDGLAQPGRGVSVNLSSEGLEKWEC
ncbi:hypothetical protein FACS1894170_13150 [Planctomycetales bacterium]|nr:hypothetical protein FACS1894170_13150 [Planctomycetales bacterium]